jgi:hypothetical protein
MKKCILFTFLICLTYFAKGQQITTLYNMDRVLQSYYINPAVESPYKFQMGGMIIPIFGQLFPPMSLSVTNSSFGYNSLFREGTGSKSGSLVLDTQDFLKKFGEVNHFRIGMDIELLGVGFSINDKFFTISLTERVMTGFSLPHDLLELAINGNAPYMRQNKKHDMSKLDLNFSHYQELGFGGTVFSNKSLRIGARAKIIFGGSNVNTSINELYLKTDPNDYSTTIVTDMSIKASLPVYFDYEVLDNDSIKISINEASVDNLSPIDYVTNTNNMGFGIDLGFTYNPTDKIELSGAVNDLGFIKWKTNPQELVINSRYDDFDGVKVEMEDNEIAYDELFNNLVDTLINKFKPEVKNINSYKTQLNTSLYLGGTFKFHNMLSVGAIYKGELYATSYLQSLSIILKSNLTEWFSLHASYSIVNSSLLNFGLGTTLRLGPFNWFVVTDNFLSALFPESSRNVNVRMGCNLVFGKK